MYRYIFTVLIVLSVASISMSDVIHVPADQPTIQQGQRAPALRFGDQRVMALFFSLCLSF